VRAERLHHVTVVSPDAAAARDTFAGTFALDPEPSVGPHALRIGGAHLEFVTPGAGTRLGAALAAAGEGMASICLEVADLDEAAAHLRAAGIACESETVAGRRQLHVEPAAAHGVRLALLART
jgi:catechol 2,3-dioxygenase-like lactoylglutathione lyase family enzyme